LAYDEDGADVSVGVDGDAVVDVSVHGQGVNLVGVSLGVGLVTKCWFLPPHFPRVLWSPSEIWESYELRYHLPS